MRDKKQYSLWIFVFLNTHCITLDLIDLRKNHCYNILDLKTIKICDPPTYFQQEPKRSDRDSNENWLLNT